VTDAQDFAALEARLAAYAQTATDPHKARAAQLFGIPVDAVTPEQRAVGKRDNYRVAYSTRGLAIHE
jgi:DNA polymerase I-like protein with 3'-5' exonuclease and polymerase domains